MIIINNNNNKQCTASTGTCVASFMALNYEADSFTIQLIYIQCRIWSVSIVVLLNFWFLGKTNIVC